jgi:hypothetical protein
MRGLFSLGAFALLAAGCGPPVAAYCDEICACSDCLTAERRACGDDVGDAQRQASKQGCSEAFNAYLACAVDAVSCTEGTVRVAGCTAEAETLYACAGDIGVGETVCDAAVLTFAEKYASCGVELPEGTGQLPSCVDFQQRLLACQADCVGKASCDAITGADGKASMALNNCRSACP